MDNEQNNLNLEFKNNKELPIEGKNKRTKRIAIIVAAALVCTLAVGGGVFAYVNSRPEVKVLKGVKATIEDLKNNKTVVEEAVGKDYFKTLQENGLNTNMKFALKSSSIPEVRQVQGSGFSLDYSIDEKNKKISGDLGYQYKGTKIGDAKFYTDDNKMMASVPQLYDAWFTCDMQNIEKQYNDSILSDGHKLPTKKPITIKLFDDEKVLEGEELGQAIMQGYIKENAEKLATIGKNIKVEKSKESKNLEIGGTNQECAGYEVSISGQDAKELVESFSDYLLSDPELKKYIAKEARLSYWLPNGPYNSPDEMVDDFYKNFKDANDKIKNSIDYNDVKAVVYLDKKGRAVSFDLKTGVDINSNKVDLECSSDFKGKDNLGDLMNISLKLTNSKNSKININFDNEKTKKDDSINQQVNLSFNNNNIEAVSINGKLGYNTKSGDFDVSYDMGSRGQAITASFKGNSKFDKTSKKLDLDFDKISLESTIRNDKFNISMDGSCSISPLENPIEDPTGEKLELFKLDKDKLGEVMKEVQDNGTKIMSTLK